MLANVYGRAVEMPARCKQHEKDYPSQMLLLVEKFSDTIALIRNEEDFIFPRSIF